MYVHGRTRILIGPALAAALVACGGDEIVDADGDGVADGVQEPNNVTVVTPTRPQGFVAGLLRDAQNGEPLAGVAVRLSLGGLSAAIVPELTTEADGAFEFGPLPAGATFALHFEAAGYAPVDLSGLIIDDTAGDFPVNNGGLFLGPIQMLRTEGQFTVQVVSQEGTPVQGARVTMETAVRYLVDGQAQGRFDANGATDADGRVTVTGLPDVWALPPSYDAVAGLAVRVSPVDLDGDGVTDFAGVTRTFTGREVREGGAIPLLVLPAPVTQGLAVIASNVAGLLGVNANPAVIEADETVQVVFNKAIDRESLVIDMRDEVGELVVTTVVVSGVENILAIGAASGFEAGREYNLAVRVQAADDTPLDVLERATPFFVRDERDRAITVTGQFLDVNDDGEWGNGGDRVEIVVSTPIGRPRANPAFVAELYLDLDLNGTSTVGDAPGELPRGGRPYPAPILVNAAEPVVANGAARSGYTRVIAPRGIGLPQPLLNRGGTVAFEVRVPSSRNAGRFVTTPSGRNVPERISGSLSFMSP